MKVFAFTLLLPWSSLAEVDFNRDIRPILSDKCFHCHGPDEETREADLRLDNFQGATEGGEFAIPIEPGKPEKSEVIARILNQAPEEIMPPPELIKKSQLGRLNFSNSGSRKEPNTMNPGPTRIRSNILLRMFRPKIGR